MSNLTSRGTDWLTSHNFEVVIGSVSIPFSKVSSIEVGIETEVLSEGGENRYAHTLFKPPSNEKVLQLERGVASDAVARGLLRVGAIFETLLIYVYDRQRKPKRIYTVYQAQLRKQSFNDLNAMNGEIFLERLEFVYRELADTSG
jgi:phage tail-like protein